MGNTVSFLTRNFGNYDRSSLAAYESIGGFSALRRALSMTGEEIAGRLAECGIRGRGGAGYDMGKKWRQVNLLLNTIQRRFTRSSNFFGVATLERLTY